MKRGPFTCAMRDAILAATERVLRSPKRLEQPQLVKRIVRVLERQARRR
jgi:hypothetical protein